VDCVSIVWQQGEFAKNFGPELNNLKLQTYSFGRYMVWSWLTKTILQTKIQIWSIWEF